MMRKVIVHTLNKSATKNNERVQNFTYYRFWIALVTLVKQIDKHDESKTFRLINVYYFLFSRYPQSEKGHPVYITVTSVTDFRTGLSRNTKQWLNLCLRLSLSHFVIILRLIRAKRRHFFLVRNVLIICVVCGLCGVCVEGPPHV